MHIINRAVSNFRGHAKWFEILKQAQNLLKNLKSLSYKNTKLKWLMLVNTRELTFIYHLELIDQA